MLNSAKSSTFKRMDEDVESYSAIYKWRNRHIKEASTDPIQLNQFHDHVMKQTVELAMQKVQEKQGEPPAPFAFFLMGSAGRFEQSVWSDQDHGIIFNGDESCLDYFLALGTEIMEGLQETGYELCDGKVMASNPLWCQSIKGWKKQIASWLEEESWGSLRHFSTFFDSRVLIGEKEFLNELKQEAFRLLDENPRLYTRLVENVDLIQKGIGIFGQLLPESKGQQTGSIKLKETAIFPYVNGARLLALKEKILLPSTMDRMQYLPDEYEALKNYNKDFYALLDFQLYSRKNVKKYQEVHLIPLDTLTKAEKQELKKLMKKGYNFFSKTKSIMEKEGSTW